MDEFDQMNHSNGEMFQEFVVEESLFAKQALLKHSSTQSQLPKNSNNSSFKKGFFNKDNKDNEAGEAGFYIY